MPGSKRAVEKQVLLLGDFVDLLFVNWESTQQVVMPYKNRCMFCCVFLVDFSLFGVITPAALFSGRYPPTHANFGRRVRRNLHGKAHRQVKGMI